MADPSKQQLGVGGGNLMSDLKSMFSVLRTRRTMWYAYGFMFTFIALTAFLAFSPSNNSSSPWFNSLFSSSDPSQKPQFSFFFYFFPNSSQTPPNITNSSPLPIPQISPNITNSSPPPISQVSANITDSSPPISQTSPNITRSPSNTTSITPPLQASISNQNQTVPKQPHLNQTVVKQPQLNQTLVKPPPTPKNETVKGVTEQNRASNFTASLLKGKNNSTNGNTNTTATKTKEEKGQISTNKDKGRSNSMMQCDIFDGNWVKDDSYPLYKPGSCALIDEQFNCYNNGRPDKDFLKYRWQPKHCNIPRLNGRDMLELLRGKRLVFVGDSLNRNMWESLVCILRNSVRDKSKVYEASGRREFRTDNSYLFIFKDYNCTVEFFRSPFLVQEWEMPEGNGSTKETLRLDLVEKSSSKYKTADVIVFNTGHWWTHEKTSKGKDYYQEGKHVYGELNVVEAFRKALTTWAKWVDVNINPKKTLVMFRGYSASHFSGGQWNSGGQCDDETEPIKNDTYLTNYPPKMRVLESVLNGMKMPVTYLNITRMTDYRKDGHPSIYRKQHLSEEERKSPLLFQDCSHWCLPGVPDSWNELLYAQLLIKKQQQQQQKEQQIQKQP